MTQLHVPQRFGGIFDLDHKIERLEEVSRELENPDIWNDAEKAQALGKERSSLQATVDTITILEEDVQDAKELVRMAAEEDDTESVKSVEEDVVRLTHALEKSSDLDYLIAHDIVFVHII